MTIFLGSVEIFTVSSQAQSVPGGGPVNEDADFEDEDDELQAGTEQ